MDKQSRREAIRAFKERTVTRGVFALRCAATGQAWLAVSRNLDPQQNSIWSGLRGGGYINREVQAAYREHGEVGISYEVLEVFDDEDLSPIGRADLAKSRLTHWLSELGAKKLVG